jgi:hypothetical protein
MTSPPQVANTCISFCLHTNCLLLKASALLEIGLSCLLCSATAVVLMSAVGRSGWRAGDSAALDLFPHFLQPHPQKHLPDLESVRSSSQMCSERNRKNDAECLLAFGVRGCFQHPPFEHVSIDLWRLRPRTIHDCLLGLESCALIATMVTGVPTPSDVTSTSTFAITIMAGSHTNHANSFHNLGGLDVHLEEDARL